MSYLVLARKYRPRSFSELIGQDHITKILENAIINNRIAHAYLFCGPRGIGKTSAARIFAQCLNCEDGPKPNPDFNSPICQEIAKGSSMDVLEIDGASNRGIDEIRTLRENVKFSPTNGKYKIYIVDEVHMLTNEAFNALLKTLEEPPAHVKFIFATTDPNKLPATIVSRCQRFDFKRIALNTIVEVLQGICKKEKLTVEEDALFVIAKSAEGSMRDALSVLDQLSALSESNVKSEDVYSMLGVVELQLMFDVVDCLAQSDCTQALLKLDSIIDQGKDLKQLYKDIVDHFRNLMVIKIGKKTLGRLVDYPVAIKEMYLKQCEYFSLVEILEAIDIFIEAQSTSRITESQRMPLEVAFAKIAYKSNDIARESVPEKPVTKLATSKPSQQAKVTAKIKEEPAPVAQEQQTKPISKEVEEMVADQNVELNIENIKRSWDALTHAVSKEKMSLATYLQEGVPIDVVGNKIVIAFAQSKSFHKEVLEEKDNVRLLATVFKTKLKVDVMFDFQIIEDVKNAKEVPLVKSALDTFKGKVVSRWHNE